jgi:hypothetical protein
MRIALLLLLCLPLAARAQGTSDDTGPIVLRLAGSTRAIALGGAYPGLSPDPDAVFYNPALLLNATGLSAASALWGSAGRLYTFSGTNGAGFAVGVHVLDYEVSRRGPRGDIGSPFGLSEDDGISSGELNATLAYARMFLGKVRLGVAAKWSRHLGEEQSAGVFAFDVGSFVNPFNWLNVALAVQNVGSRLEFDGAQYELPTRVALNAATRSRPLGPLDFSLAGRVSGGPDDDVSAGLGVEIGYWPFSGLNFYARGGVKAGTGSYQHPDLDDVIEESPFSLGGGLSYGRISLDYALEPYAHASDAHRVGLRVR